MKVTLLFALTINPTKGHQGFEGEGLRPIVLVPGIAGTGLFAVESPDFDVPECREFRLFNRTSPYRMWAAISELGPPASRQKCWAAKMALETPQCQTGFNDCILQTTGPESLYRNQKGLSVAIDSPGETKGFEYLDYMYHYGVPGSDYFGTLADALRRAGYANNVTMFGFPYDWRMPLWQIDTQSFRHTIERAKNVTGRKVIILSHSLGSVLTNYFLNKAVDATWKEEYIEAFISVAGAFGGSPKVVRCMLSGYDGIMINIWNFIHIKWLPPKLTRPFLRTLGSLFDLIPSPTVYAENVPIVHVVNGSMPQPSNIPVITVDAYSSFHRTWESVKQTVNDWISSIAKPFKITNSLNLAPSRNQAWLERVNARIAPVEPDFEDFPLKVGVYTSRNWTLLLPPKMRVLSEQARTYTEDTLADPNVPVYCIWPRFSTPTTESAYIFDVNDIDGDPTAKTTWGDNTLPLESLRWCKRWNSTKFVYEMLNVDHMEILRNPDFIRFIVPLLTQTIVS